MCPENNPHLGEFGRYVYKRAEYGRIPEQAPTKFERYLSTYKVEPKE